MTKAGNIDKRYSLVVDFAIAVVLALGLGAVGLAEVAWLPFFFVAVESARRGGCFDPRRRGARS